MTGPSELSWPVNFLQILFSKNIVAVCDEGPSLTVLATLFRVNSGKAKEACASFCRNLRLRTFQCVEFVLSMSVRHYLQAADMSSTGSVEVTATCATSPLSHITSRTKFEWKEIAGFTTLGNLALIQKMMAESRCEPEHSKEGS